MAQSGKAHPPPPVVDLAVGIVHPLPPHLQATLNPIQRKMRSIPGLILYMIIGLVSVTFPVLVLPPALYFLSYVGILPHWAIQRFFDLCCGNWITLMTLLFENLFGIKIRTFGFGEKLKKRSLIIMNHVSHLDWIYLWDVMDRQGDLSSWKAITKRVPVFYIPIIGYCMQMSCFLFISRKWESDRLEFQNKLYYFNALQYPIQLLLFPEGGDLTPKTRQRSDAFADENQLPRIQYCFHPRTTGFTYAVNAMRDGGLDAVYDLTIAYPDVLPKTELDVWHGIFPREVHFHVRKFDDADLPRAHQQEEMKAWLRDRWLEKEERLKDFYTHKRFKESETTNQDNNMDAKPDTPEVVRPRNIRFLLYSIFIIFFTNLSIFTLWAYVPYYFTVYFLVSSTFMVYYCRYKDLSEYTVSFKRREVEKAVQQASSRHNTSSNGNVCS